MTDEQISDKLELLLSTPDEIWEQTSDWWMMQKASVTDPIVEAFIAVGSKETSPWSWAWHNRKGSPWQSSIESHVASYRRKPRELCTWAAMGLVLNKMNKRGYSYGVWGVTGFSSVQKYAIAAFSISVHPPTPRELRGGFSASDRSLPRAVCLAAIAALEQEAPR